MTLPIKDILEMIIPARNGIVTVIQGKPGERVGRGLNSNAHFVLIPRQDDKGAQGVLNNIKATGWDWLPEKLSHSTLPALNLPVWFASPYHSYTEVIHQVTQHLHLQELYLTQDEINELYNHDYSPSAMKEETSYARCRFLWKYNHTQFNDWETKFVKDIGTRLSKKEKLSPRQLDALKALFLKYGVAQDATASSDSIPQPD